MRDLKEFFGRFGKWIALGIILIVACVVATIELPRAFQKYNDGRQAAAIENRVQLTMYAIENAAKPTAAPTATSAPTTTPVPTLTPTLTPTATPIPAMATPVAPVDPTKFFVTKTVGCEPVNVIWPEKKGTKYTIDPAAKIFPPGAFTYFEGETVKDPGAQTVQVISGTVTFEAFQGNAWTCGPMPEDLKVVHTVLFESVDKKFLNQASIDLVKPYIVKTPYGIFKYAAGEKPAWAPTVRPIVSVKDCPETSLELASGSLPGDPNATHTVSATNAACNVVVVTAKDRKATLYSGNNPMLERLTIAPADHVYIVNPKLTPAQLEKALNLGKIDDARTTK